MWKTERGFPENLGIAIPPPLSEPPPNLGGVGDRSEKETHGPGFGENPVPQRHELVFRSDPEWGAVENTIPASGGGPKYNPYDKNLQFRRSKYVRKISS